MLGLTAIFGGVSSFVEVESHVDALTMVAAIMGGSFCYWFVVSQRISQIRHRLDKVRLGQINRIAGLVLIAFGGKSVHTRFIHSMSRTHRYYTLMCAASVPRLCGLI